MASFVISGTTVTQQSLQSLQTGLITTNGTLAVSDITKVDAVVMSGNSSLAVLGTLSGWDSAISLTSTSHMTLTVGMAGNVICTDQALHGGYSGSVTVANAGLISADTAIALATQAANTSFVLNNSGTILANSLGSAAGIRITTPYAADFAINNSGDILYSGTGTAIDFAGSLGDVNFTNSGTISATDASAAISCDGDTRLENTGTVLGAIVLGAGIDRVLNMGTIRGEIYLGDGPNSFTNLGGRVLGVVFGGSGSDSYAVDSSSLRISDTAGGADTVVSTASYRLSVGLETLRLNSADGLTGIGSSLANSLTGSDGDDTLRGLAGNDTVSGGEGCNLLGAGRGNDLLTGGEGDDTLHGGADNDTVLIGYGDDSLDGGAGIDLLSADIDLLAQDMVINLGLGRVQFGPGDVSVVAGFENVTAGLANDLVTGSAGDNLMSGSLGQDTIVGGAGHDTIIGGHGSDLMNGGGGADEFRFVLATDSGAASPDLITGFQAALDVINLALIDANPATAGTDDAFAFIGTAAFAGAAGQVRYAKDIPSDTTSIEVRLAGSALPDMVITLAGQVTLTADAFLL